MNMYSACCSQQVLICSCHLFCCVTFFQELFYAEIQCVWALEQLILSHSKPVGFFWVTVILTNVMLILYEKYDLNCWLSPVAGTLRQFGWNLVLRKILAWKLILSFVDITSRSRVSSLPLQCVLNKWVHLVKQIAVPTIFLNLSKSANRDASGSQKIFLQIKLKSHTRCCTRSIHICLYFNTSV